MGKQDLMTEQSLDFIFMADRNDVSKRTDQDDHKNNEDSKTEGRSNDDINIGLDIDRLITGTREFKINKNSITVEMFLTEGKYFGSLSDHFGLSVDVVNIK